MRSTGTILLVEDNEDDAFFMQRALRAAGVENPVQLAEDGQQAIDYLAGAGPYADRTRTPLPFLVILDLKLPFKSGHEVLAWIRAQPALRSLIVLVLTSSSEPVDLRSAYAAGANSYVVKPPTSQALLGLAQAFKLWWLQHNELPSAAPVGK